MSTKRQDDDSVQPPSKLQGWPDIIDHTERHALVDADRRIKWIIHPHLRGSINGPSGTVVDTDAGESIVRVNGRFTDAHRELYRSRMAALDEDGYIVEVTRCLTRSEAIAQGYDHHGVHVSLDVDTIQRCIASLTVSHALSYPREMCGVTFLDEPSLQAFCTQVLDYYLSL